MTCPEDVRKVLRDMILSDPEGENGESRTDAIIDEHWPRLRECFVSPKLAAAAARLRAAFS